ncbi:MAG TPA: sigma 54-interacting transcriptional regulator [Fimbriiglobus sp.]|nr:sigma 54-interacting transcriptional regulator [Fimbriiglobus sp.]
MHARLILEAGECVPGALDLNPSHPATLGRSRENSLVVKNDLVSRLHVKIYYEDGRWVLRDFGLNGTRVNGVKVNGAIPLADGAVIQLGEARLRFTISTNKPPPSQTPAPITPAPGTVPLLPEAGTGLSPSLSGSSSVVRNGSEIVNTKAHEHPQRRTVPDLDPDPSETQLKVDELTALCRFMTSAVGVHDPQELVRHTLRTILNQTSATVAGYLSLDPSDPTPKLVMPDRAAVDVRLSKRLTERVRSTSKMVWLFGDGNASNPGDSLSSFTDAVCLPLATHTGDPFAAIHVYRTGRGFADRDVRFLEVTAGFLAPTLEIHRTRRKLEAENTRLRIVAPVADELIGDSDSVTALRQQIAKAAPQPFNVLIQGESGSGKELVAQALHHNSQRADGPLVVVNCAAIAPTLLEAELFGYRKGAFSGADRDHPGYFEQADEGTLFLDEVGELSLECQAKLLRVIEGKAFRPVGGTRDVKVDFRVVAATHRNLDDEVRANKFRQDLLFRLQVIHLRVPPLREHDEDIQELARFFLERLSVQCRRQFKLTPAAMRKLQAFAWPGNVRQLRAVLESAAVMSEMDQIDADGLPLAVHEPAPLASAAGGADLPPTLDVDELETWAIRKALQQTGGNVSQAARVLGMSRDTLHTKLKKKGIDREAVLQASAAGD